MSARARQRLGILGLVVLALALALPAAASSTPPRTTSSIDALEASVLVELNAVRAGHGLAPLRLTPSLSAAANAHSLAMAQRGFFSHSSADGTAFWKRVQRYYRSTGFGYWSVGENLLWKSPTIDAADAIRMWLESPSHRKNLLAPQWREIGLAAVRASAAPGAFEGLDVTIVTADFGVRR
jgi:uncharacterized protein YkwD